MWFLQQSCGQLECCDVQDSSSIELLSQLMELSFGQPSLSAHSKEKKTAYK